jgi:CelD/BcsL family acetyltransferase involved in cellulose biosynthesis
MFATAVTPARGAGAPDVDLVEGLDALREDWTHLAEASHNIFATWEWNSLWWRRYGGDRRLRVAVVGEGDAQAIVPLFEWSRRPLRALRLLGHGHGDRLGPICAEDDPQVSAQAMRLALAAEPHDVLVGDWVAGDRSWAQVLGGRVVRTTGYPILDLTHGSWQEFLAGRSPKFRKSVRHGHNRLRRDGDVGVRATTADSLERDLDTAFRLHRARFGAHAGCHFCGAHERFHREFAAVAFDRGWLRLLFLEVEGEPVASEYGFVFQDAYFAYQGGRDPAWDRHSVGFLLEVESIRRALEEGLQEYRFLGGAEGYKYRYPTTDPGLETIVVPASRSGRVAAAALDAAWRLPGGRSILRRLGSA